jgi:hypothetical protein
MTNNGDTTKFQPDLYQPPFPWFGGKSRAASLIWERLGDVTNYVEPFFGSGAALFLRPHWPFENNRIETINDKDSYVANFWRAVQVEPEIVAHWADWPINEADLHARHWWLVNQADFRQKMMTDPDYYDAKIAGWWVWGICQWIGAGWCVHPEWQTLNHLGDPGQGVHRPSQKLNHLGDLGRGDLYDYFEAIAARLRRVRVICGDWRRVLGPTPTEKLGLTGILLDPPYSKEAGRDKTLYSVEDLSIAHQVREWAIENGNNPLLRICLCGYEGEHTMPENWTKVEWKAAGGYSSQNKSGDNQNKYLERLWFSPYCLRPERVQQLELIP